MDKLAPVILFVFNRPEHTKCILEKLNQDFLAKYTDLIIYSDNYKLNKDQKKVSEVREYINNFKRKNNFNSVEINYSNSNLGLAKSVIEGVTKVIKKNGKVIVLEDDIYTTKWFLKYMNDALAFYRNNEKIWSISAFSVPIHKISNNHDVFFIKRGHSWGWATWSDRWETVDWEVKDYKKFRSSPKKRRKFNEGGSDLGGMLDLQMNGMIDSWAIRWCYAQNKQDKYTVYPFLSLVKNIGLDGSGTHSGVAPQFSVNVEEKNQEIRFEKFYYDKKIIKKFKKIYDISLWKRVYMYCINVVYYQLIKKSNIRN